MAWSTLTKFKYNLHCICIHSDWAPVKDKHWLPYVVLFCVATRKCRCAAGSRNSSSVVDDCQPVASMLATWSYCASPPTVKCCSSVAVIYCSGLFGAGGACSRPVMMWQLLLHCSLHCICMHCLYNSLQCFNVNIVYNIEKKRHSFDHLSKTCVIMLLIPKTHWETVCGFAGCGATPGIWVKERFLL